MAKSFASKNLTVNFHGVLDVSLDDNTIYIVNEDGEARALSEFLGMFDNCEVSVAVKEVVEMA